MMAPGTYRFVHPVHGPLKLNVRSTARNITMRRLDCGIGVTLPPWVGEAEFERALDQLVPRLGPSRALPRFEPGQDLVLPFHTFHFVVADSMDPGAITATWSIAETTVAMGRGVTVDDDSTSRRVSDLLVKVAGRVSLKAMMPLVRSVEARLGIEGVEWGTMRGFTRLGKCYTGRREIKLSSALLFLPDVELVELVVCHELAHLTHADHSPAFHALCDRYLGGREKQLNSRLKRVSWPIAR